MAIAQVYVAKAEKYARRADRAKPAEDNGGNLALAVLRFGAPCLTASVRAPLRFRLVLR